MIKISQMPIYSGDLDGVYVPIIVPDPGVEPWVNYRMLASNLESEGETVEADNGVIKTAYGIIELGGNPLTHDTVIDVAGFDFSLPNLNTGTEANVLYYD